MREYDVNIFIHGHTHRPDIHHFELDGQARRRIVLGDWYDQGSILFADANSLNLQIRPFA